MHDPVVLFQEWFEQARSHPQIAEPTAMSLATATPDGRPSVRIVLLKEAQADGFVFYTNSKSRKGNELFTNPHAALCFYWMPLHKQVRIEGTITKVSDSEADAYFATRERMKQLGAWASEQSQHLASHEELVQRVERFSKQYEGKEVPRPPHWTGFRLLPLYYEFWNQGEARLHERELFTKQQSGEWKKSLLYP